MKVNDSPQNNSLDIKRLYYYVKTFSFPRLAGTNGEKKAVNLTLKIFKDIGFKDHQIQKEHFKFSDFFLLH